MFINQIAPNHFYLTNYYYFFLVEFHLRLFQDFSSHCDSKSATGHIKVKRKKEVLMVLITNYCFFATFTPGFALRASSVYRENFSNIFFSKCRFGKKYKSSSHDNNNFLQNSGRFFYYKNKL